MAKCPDSLITDYEKLLALLDSDEYANNYNKIILKTKGITEYDLPIEIWNNNYKIHDMFRNELTLIPHPGYNYIGIIYINPLFLDLDDFFLYFNTGFDFDLTDQRYFLFQCGEGHFYGTLHIEYDEKDKRIELTFEKVGIYCYWGKLANKNN